MLIGRPVTKIEGMLKETLRFFLAQHRLCRCLRAIFTLSTAEPLLPSLQPVPGRSTQ